MSPFDHKFIENPRFLEWVFRFNQEVESYWEQYLLENPQEAEPLLELKERLTELRFTNDKLRFSEKEELENRIIRRLKRDLKEKKRRLMVNSLMKYAAVALIFAAIGGLVVYLNMGKKSVYDEFARQTIQAPSAAQGPLLITSNGENVNLKRSNSTVDYSRRGAVVLNNDSVLQIREEVANVMNQLVIPYGNQSRIVLSDNTIVWLNAGSRLVYPTLFKGKIREVLLFGEAYFEVAKNPDQPFIVKTSNLDIRVLGTKFNISTYAEDNVIQTVLKEGSVAVRRIGAGFFEKDIVLVPNQMALFDKTTGDTRIQEVDPNYYTLWTKGLISFDEIDLVRVIKKLERFYNISVKFSDPQKEMIRISGKLDLKRSRKEVMEYLEKVSSSRFDQVNENQYTIK
jgi:ferric-dicitrate binding protein FerR (iron transport regulator)